MYYRPDNRTIAKPEPELLTITAVAKRLGVHRSSVNELIVRAGLEGGNGLVLSSGTTERGIPWRAYHVDSSGLETLKLHVTDNDLRPTPPTRPTTDNNAYLAAKGF